MNELKYEDGWRLVAINAFARSYTNIHTGESLHVLM